MVWAWKAVVVCIIVKITVIEKNEIYQSQMLNNTVAQERTLR